MSFCVRITYCLLSKMLLVSADVFSCWECTICCILDLQKETFLRNESVACRMKELCETSLNLIQMLKNVIAGRVN